MTKEVKGIVRKERICGDLKEMGQIAESLAGRILGKKAFIKADVICHWAEIVGEEWANLAKPLDIEFRKEERKKGVLSVEVASGAIALELELKSKLILAKVNTYFGYEAVERIKIIQNLEMIKNINQSSDNLEKMLVSKEEENYIMQQADAIVNQSLGLALQNLGKAIFKHNKKM